MSLLLDIAFILKPRKPITDERLGETQTHTSQEQSLSSTIETTGNHIIHTLYIVSCCE